MIIIYSGMVHGDYTLSSAPQRIKDFGNPPKANDTLAVAASIGFLESFFNAIDCTNI